MELPKIVLPRDEGPQKDPVEWWYWNGHLKSRDKQEYSYMLALFKGGIFGIKDIFFAHWQISDLKRKTFESFYQVFWYGLDRGSFAKRKLNAKSGKTFAIKKIGRNGFRLATPEFDLKLQAQKPPLLAGGTGFVDLKETSTTYYSLPRLKTRGKLRVNGQRVPVEGLSWMDHQWSPLSFNVEQAWTWFCFQFDDGTDLMCFEHGRKNRTRLATISWPDGSLQVFRDVKFIKQGKAWKSPVSGAAYPEAWKIVIPSGRISLSCRAQVPEQEMIHGPFRYWEGSVRVTGKIGKRQVSGQGFMELNGVPGKTFAELLATAVKRRLKTGD